MKYENPQLRQMLAAEYVLGTLRGPARARFARLLRSSPALAAEVRAWERRLAGLALRLAPDTPRARVWTEIDRLINAVPAGALPAARPAGPNLWRAWALAASLASVGLGWQLWQQVHAPPRVVEVERIVKVPQPMPYVAVLQPGGDVKLLLALSPDRHVMKVSVSGTQPPVDYQTRSLELWVLDESGKPHSLGVMPVAGEMEMPLPQNMPMPEKPTLAISDEPKGGSTTGQPTGPVLTAGPAIRAL